LRDNIESSAIVTGIAMFHLKQMSHLSSVLVAFIGLSM
jgi:hypothetical protein